VKDTPSAPCADADSPLERSPPNSDAPTRRYRPFKASHRTRGRRSRSRRNARITSETWTTVERYLCLDWSPEQVAGFLRAEHILSISHETIYVHVWHDKTNGGDLCGST
jgi:IS30 family transposase